MKRVKFIFVALFAPLLTLFFAVGCIQHLELDERLILQTIGLDYENGEFIITAQYYMGGGGDPGKGGGSTGSPTIYTATGKGSSIAHALQETGFNSGRLVLLKEAQLFILGAGLKEQKFSDLLVSFTNEYESYPNISVASSVGKASDLLSVKYKDNSATVHRLHKLLQTAEETGISLQSHLFNVMRNSLNTLGSALLPLLDVQDEKSDLTEDGRIVKIVGSTLVKKNSYLKDIGLAESSGFLWLKNRAFMSTLTIEHRERSVMANLFDLSTTMTARTENGQIIIDVHGAALAGYLETHLAGKTPEEDLIIEEKLELAVIERIMGALKIITDDGIDILNIEEVVRNYDYRLWKQVESDWENVIKTISFNVTADVKLSRYSLSW